MKKFAVFLALSLSTSMYAQAQTHDVDIDALPDCSEISEDVIYGNESYTCVSKRDISDEELTKEHLFDYSVAATYDGSSPYISLNRLPTEFILNNKGGYNARMIVTHYQNNPINGHWTRLETTTNSIPVGAKASVTVHGDTVNAEIRIQRHSAIKWETIVNDTVTEEENRWVANDNSKNKMQWDVWGTVFNSPHKNVQPADTYDYFSSGK